MPRALSVITRDLLLNSTEFEIFESKELQEKIDELTIQLKAKEEAHAGLVGRDIRTEAIIKSEGFIDNIIDELTEELGRPPTINEIKDRMIRQGAKKLPMTSSNLLQKVNKHLLISPALEPNKTLMLSIKNTV